jgi:hypothetical protein
MALISARGNAPLALTNRGLPPPSARGSGPVPVAAHASMARAPTAIVDESVAIPAPVTAAMVHDEALASAPFASVDEMAAAERALPSINLALEIRYEPELPYEGVFVLCHQNVLQYSPAPLR